MKLLVRALTLSAPLLLLAGCPSTGDGSSSVSEDDAPDVISTQACKLYFDCSCNDFFDPQFFTSEEACKTELEGILIGAVDQGQMAELTYDADCVGEVFDLYNDLSCTTPDGLDLEDLAALTEQSNCKVYYGDREEGQSCETTLEIGDDCVQGALCENGTCVSDPTTTLPDPGEECDTQFLSLCDGGAICLDVDGDGPEPSVCTVLPGSGETCFGALDLCGEGLACNQADKACEPAPGEGEPCADVVLDRCGANLVCNQDVCVALPTLGEPCVNNQCADGFACENDQCVESAALSCGYAPGILD